MEDEALFHRIWLEFRVQRSKEIQQQLRYLTLGRSVGARMRTLRFLLGLTQKQLASALGISVRTVIRYEGEQCDRPWLRLWVGLRELESAYADELVPYLERREASNESASRLEARFG